MDLVVRNARLASAPEAPPVGPPWACTISGGFSPAGAVKPSFFGA